MTSKVWTVASVELSLLVRTRAFVITVLLMPIIMIGSIGIQRLVSKQVDTTPRKFAVIDSTGKLYAGIEKRAKQRNLVAATGLLQGAKFNPERVDPAGKTPEEVRLEQSDRVRREEIFAFVEIPAGVFEPGPARLSYFSDAPTYGDLLSWLEDGVNEDIQGQRLRAAGVDPEVVERLGKPVDAENLGLLARGPSGEVRPAPRVDLVRTTVVPLVLMYILFLTIFMSAPQLMNAVMQEKMSKISEVLIGSISSFELMLGKLLGSAGVSVILALVYLGGGLSMAGYWGYTGLLSPGMAAVFFVFMTLAVLFYGSIFVAVGAAVSDIKDAQSLVTPVMLIAVVPMFAWQAVLKSPNSAFSVAISLFPPATPFMMLLRMAVQPSPPWWQVVLGILLTLLAMVGMVWAAARVFRVGILATGKSATLGQMLKWIRVK